MHRQSGAALLVTLLLIGFLAVCLATFFLVASGSRQRSTADREHARARLYADLAAHEAMAKVATGFAEAAGTGTEPCGSVTASPGLMEVRYFDVAPNRGTERGAAAFANNPARPPFFRNPFFESYSNRTANPRWIPLFSWKWFAPALPNLKIVKGKATEANPDFNPAAVFDLNTTKNPFHPGHHYLTGVPATPVALRFQNEESAELPPTFAPGESAADRPVYVQWIPVLRDPAQPPGKDNPMVGRYAYWVDVENTKVNLLTSTRALRQTDFFARLSGDADAEAGSGTRHFEQSETNPYRQAQQALEGSLARKASGTKGTFTADGLPGQGSNFAAREMRDLLLGWRNGARPFTADNSLVDWDYFNGLRPAANRRGERIAFDDLIGQLARAVQSTPDLALNSWDEVFSLLDPALQERDAAQARLVRDSLRRTLGASTTIYGYEEERDPLGRPKLDFVKFLLEARKYAGAGGSPVGLKSTELWSRLADAKYHRAYYPGAYPSGGSARSFLASLNRFAGTGNASDNLNGELATQQMLVNVLEATLPDSVPPLIDANTGIVGMRSVPYVGEVATRARSAIWLLPEALRNDTDALLAPDFKYNGKDLLYYLTNVVLDVAIGCVNPDPFSHRHFTGTLKLNYLWDPELEKVSTVVKGPLTAPLDGKFTALPLPGEKAGKIRVDGEAAYFRLGVVPGKILQDKKYATGLRILGWEIRDASGALWHQVPIRNPRAQTVPYWWQMAEQGVNAGTDASKPSLLAFQADATNFGYRAVGWFCVEPSDKTQIERISIPEEEAAPPRKLSEERLRSFLEKARRATFVERVASRDPALGHRTGNRALVGVNGQKGHFYGMLGHTWRHIDRQPGSGSVDGDEEAQEPDDDGDGDSEKSTYALNVATYAEGAHTLRATTRLPAGATYTSSTIATSVPVVRGSDAQRKTAEAWGQKADSLTALFSDPNYDGLATDSRWKKCPLWEIDGALSGDDSKEPVKDTDIETTATYSTLAGVKTKEARLGVRGFFAGAPRGGMMTSIGELGFCHSGLPNFPIILSDAVGWNEHLLNCPRNGPPMRMLLDLFTPGAFTDAETGHSLSEGAWRSGNYTSHSPGRPRRGTWNMNTSIAHDAYLAIREGDTDTVDLKKEFDPTPLAVRAAWAPSAAGYRRVEGGAEWFRGKKLEDLAKKNAIGLPLDRYSGPSPVMNRGSNAWVALLGGDFTLGRVSGGTRWGFNNTGAQFFGPAQFTWNAGTGAVPYGSPVPFADFSSGGETNAKLLTFGSDGRKDGGLTADDLAKGKSENAGFLRGRFAADQGLLAAQANPAACVPLTNVTRFSLVPMRHFTSDLAQEFNFGAPLNDFKTALNPRQSGFAPMRKADGTIDWKSSDGTSFPGGHHASGIFANAPIALLANQVSTSANVFTIHIVAQAVKDTGKARTGVKNSGPGHSDPDDEIASERWMRRVVEKAPTTDNSGSPVRLRILATEVSGP